MEAGVQLETGTVPDLPDFCMSTTVKPLLEFIHKFRLKAAPPAESRAFRKMTDLKYIAQRLDQVESEIKKELLLGTKNENVLPMRGYLLCPLANR